MYAFTPLNISRLHTTASEWKSDISPVNLNNIQKRYTWQVLPVVVTDVSTGIGAWMQIAQYKAWCVEFLKHLTDLSWIILSCFFFFFPDYFRWHFCSAGQQQQGVTAETEQRERMTCNKGHKRRTCYICFNSDNRESAELLLSNFVLGSIYISVYCRSANQPLSPTCHIVLQHTDHRQELYL